jgi:3-oxoadipate enol-lactonase
MPLMVTNGIRLYYEVHGAGDPIVLIPGLASDLTEYQPIVSALAQRYKVVTFENRGAGRSDKPSGPYSIEQIAMDADGQLTALEIGPAPILGISLGGRIAVALALRYPERVSRLILVSTSVKRRPLRGLARVIFNLLLVVPVLQTIGRPNRQDYIALIRQRDAARAYDATDRLPELSMPTLILHGKSDRLAPYGDAKQMHADIPVSQLITFDGGHLFCFFQQTPFVDAVLDFLAAPSTSSRERV